MRSILNYLIIIIISATLVACGSTQLLRTTVQTTPIYSVDPERVLLLNMVDIAGQKYRDGKEELFVQLVDNTLIDLAREIKDRIGIESVIQPGFVKGGETTLSIDSVVRVLMLEKEASDAIVINSFDAYFYKNDVEITIHDDGTKSRELKFDITSEIQYLWYNKTGLYSDKKIHVSRHHSSRQVISGALAVGPNIVTQQNDAIVITEENMNKYLNLFLPGYEYRTRHLHTGGAFKPVKQAIVAQNFDVALSESKRLLNHSNPRIAAKANYNCAVLCESLGKYNQVITYLIESDRLYPDIYTSLMLEDY
jgi:hypothetical protein